MLKLGLPTPQSYLVKNLGLSLTDHYWIKPIDTDLTWQDINLFTNDFKDPVGQMQMGELPEEIPEPAENAFSPSSSLQGKLKKKWVIDNGKRCLIKGNRGSNSQESLNEVFATLLHKKQGVFPYVSYSPFCRDDRSQIYSVCESFTSDAIELIPAVDVLDSKKKDNSLSVYEHFIEVCSDHGMDETVTRPFLEYQILTGYVITNVDRHLNNFGVLRDTSTLQFIGMAPIFDFGDSMFRDNPGMPEYSDLSDIAVNSFRNTESQLLGYVHDTALIDIFKLPSCDELKGIYAMDRYIPYIDSIVLGYKKKIDLLCKMIQ